jgi:hypothetical protein
MFKITSIATGLALLAFSADGQDFQTQFKDAVTNNDSTGQIKVLNAWSAASPKDPELFIAFFNYYVRKSITESISLDGTQKDKNLLVLNDTASGKPVGYLNASTNYKSDVLQKGFDYINQGIALFPTRLDMRFGKIYMLGQAENYPVFAQEIVTAIEYGNTIKNQWLWKDGKPLEEAKQFFLRSLQDYHATIYL